MLYLGDLLHKICVTFLEFEKKNNNVKNNSVEFHDSKILTLIVLFYEGRRSTVNNAKRNLSLLQTYLQ